MGGKEYKSGFTITDSKNCGQAIYNLEGKYTSFSGLIGNVDGFNNPATICVYGDDRLLDTLEVEGAALPKEFRIPVSGVRQLKIAGTDNGYSAYQTIGFADAVFE